MNTNEIIKQVQDLLASDNKDIEIPVNTIVGIDDCDELVYIENISLYKHSDKPSLNISGGTYRKITRNDIVERRSEDWAEEERDMWVEMVRAGRTDDGLYEWWEQACDEAESEGLLYPFDDDSDRSMIENAYNKMPKNKRTIIEETWGEKGNYEEDMDEEINLNSDWVTVYWGSTCPMGCSGYANRPKSVVEQVKNWKCITEPKLVKFLAETIDELREQDKEEV